MLSSTFQKALLLPWISTPVQRQGMCKWARRSLLFCCNPPWLQLPCCSVMLGFCLIYARSTCQTHQKEGRNWFATYHYLLNSQEPGQKSCSICITIVQIVSWLIKWVSDLGGDGGEEWPRIHNKFQESWFYALTLPAAMLMNQSKCLARFGPSHLTGLVT